MTQDEIIRMAREAGLFNQHNEDLLQDKEVMAQFERFAALVAAHEREKWEQALPIAMDAMMLQEREACAKVCDAIQKKHEDEGAWLWEAKNCAAAIRARGEK